MTATTVVVGKRRWPSYLFIGLLFLIGVYYIGGGWYFANKSFMRNSRPRSSDFSAFRRSFLRSRSITAHRPREGRRTRA